MILLNCMETVHLKNDAAIVGGIAFHLMGKQLQLLGINVEKQQRKTFVETLGCHIEGYRKALRLMKQAEKFKRPIICFIDTKGAYPGKAAEERAK